MIVSRKMGRSRHEKTGRHLEAEQIYLNNRTNGEQNQNVVRTDTKSQSLPLSSSTSTTSISTTSSTSYPWAVHFSNAQHTYYCKYCKMRLSTGYKKEKHQKTKNHKINEEIWKSKYGKEDDDSAKANDKNEEKTIVSATTAKSNLGKGPSYESLIKLWRIKYNWLMYKRDEMRPFYAYCKLCQKSIFVRTSKNASRHQKTGSHIRHKLKRNQILKQQQKPQEEQDRQGPNTSTVANALEKANDIEQQQLHTQELNNKQDDDEELTALKKTYVWIEMSTVPNYVYCRQCDAHILCRYNQIKNHHYSKGHRKLKTRCSSLDSNVSKLARLELHKEENTNVQHSNKNVVDTSPYVTERRDESMNILDISKDDNNISQDELSVHPDVFRRKYNYSVKSDAAIPHENETNPPKRFKRFQNESEYYDGRQVMTDILNTPLTLASCLGPLIQQQIQQTTSNIAQNMNQSSNEKFVMHESPNTEHSFDLFFRSISETMKKLPPALAAEGKVRIMHVICDLELKALQADNNQQKINENSFTENANSNSNAQTSTYTNANTNANTNTNTNANANGNANANANTNTNTNANANINANVNANTNTNANANTTNQTTAEKLPINNVERSTNECAPIESGETERSTKTPSPTLTTVASSVIRLMDKEGLHLIHVRRTAPSEQNTNLSRSLNESTSTPSTISKTGNTRSSTATTKIRCIPIKSLTNVNATMQNNNNNNNNNNNCNNININSNSNSNSNSNVHVRAPVTATLTGQSYSAHANTLTNLNTNTVLNYRNAQISKKATLPSQSGGINVQQSPHCVSLQKNIPVNTLNGSFISSPLLSSNLSITSTPRSTMSTIGTSSFTSSTSMQRN